jgi:transcription regulator MmyB-like protein
VPAEILDSLEPLPAMLLNARYDVLASNQAQHDLCYRWHAVACLHRNILWCCFTEPDVRRRFVNSDEEAPLMVATLRASFGQHLGEPAWTRFIQRLSEASPAFAQLWTRHEVASPGSRTKHFLHPRRGCCAGAPPAWPWPTCRRRASWCTRPWTTTPASACR